jgi:hypothetical protein
MLNRGDTSKINGNFNLIVSNVLNWCPSALMALYYIRNNGKLYALGINLYAGYGFPNGQQKALTRDIGDDSNYLGISDAVKVYSTTTAGGYLNTDNTKNTRTFVVHADGTVSACGNNEAGSLGVNSSDPFIFEWRKVKTLVNGIPVDLSNVNDIVVGNYSDQGTHRVTTFLLKDGTVYTCGDNTFGKLGLGLATTATVSIATQTSLTNVAMIAPAEGGASMLAATTDNKLYSWGCNVWGQLGTGDQKDRNVPTQVVFPDKKIRMIHGGGMYGVVNGAFLVVTTDGCVYGAGFNSTYALGYTVNGVSPAVITTFTENQYYGPNPSEIQDKVRYPLVLTANQTAGLDTLTNAVLSVQKNIAPYSDNSISWTETVYVRVGMRVIGTGIPDNTFVKFVDYQNNIVILTNAVTTTQVGNTLTYKNIIRVYAADICGYKTELAQKCVSEDGTLYMSGWNQLLAGVWNFNPYINTQNVLVPQAYEANFG